MQTWTWSSFEIWKAYNSKRRKQRHGEREKKWKQSTKRRNSGTRVKKWEKKRDKEIMFFFLYSVNSLCRMLLLWKYDFIYTDILSHTFAMMRCLILDFLPGQRINLFRDASKSHLFTHDAFCLFFFFFLGIRYPTKTKHTLHWFV